MSRLRVGLVGYGSWARSAYIPALRRDGRAEIVSVAVHSERTRDRVHRDLGDGVVIFPDVAALLNGPEIDAVMIAVADTAHERTLLEALGSGVPVFYEPPITAVRRNLPFVMQELLSAEQITFADLELGLLPVVEQASQRVRAGDLGSVQRAHIRLQSGWGPVPDYDLCNFNHLCTWYVDVLNRILGSLPKRVLLLDGHGTAGRRQSQSIGYLDYDGIWGAVQANIASVGDLSITAEINGEDGDLCIDLLTGELRIRSRSNPDWLMEQWPAMQPHADWPGVHESVQSFLDAVEAQGSSINDAMTVAKLQLVGLAAEASKDTGTWSEVGDLSPILAQSGQAPDAGKRWL